MSLNTGRHRVFWKTKMTLVKICENGVIVVGFTLLLQTCKLAEQNLVYTYVWNDHAASPYLHGTDKLWVSFEDVRSVRVKTQYARNLGIAGVMVYNIGSDDIYGFCGNGTYPLLRAIRQELNDGHA
ncbi:hypothetical protein KIN20_009466 [Parelaphostrongylus tenuis]|uniref:GH18 domain-containing protein n=1 Tax=Parelaphostrongylus tenuis TaxID=148309 RepID=A0AAD5M6E6_PARTN|nr:hypothetical protein KIN20_009466 [Parelaphostrongylus tenuis]